MLPILKVIVIVIILILTKSNCNCNHYICFQEVIGIVMTQGSDKHTNIHTSKQQISLLISHGGAS